MVGGAIDSTSAAGYWALGLAKMVGSPAIAPANEPTGDNEPVMRG